MSAYAVRRRLVESERRPFIDELDARGIRRDFVVDALLLVDGNVDAVRAALDRFQVLQKMPYRDEDLTRVLAYLREGGAQL